MPDYQPESSNEETLLEVHPAMFRESPGMFILSILLIPAFGVGLVMLAGWYVKTLGTTLTVSDRRTILRTGLLSKNTTEVLHRDIRNIQISQTALERLFNAGKIAISSAGQDDIEIYFKGAHDPEGIKALIDRYRFGKDRADE